MDKLRKIKLSLLSTFLKDYADEQNKGIPAQYEINKTVTYLVELNKILLALVVKFMMALSGFGWV